MSTKQGIVRSIFLRLVHVSLSAFLLASPLAAHTASTSRPPVKPSPGYTRNADPLIRLDWRANTFVGSALRYGPGKLGPDGAALDRPRSGFGHPTHAAI